MKITKQQLKDIIKEELEMVKEVEVQGKEWVDIYVAQINDHLEEMNTEGRGYVMQLIKALAMAAKGG